MLMLLVNEKRTLQQMNLSYVTLTYTITYCCINIIIMLKQQREAETVCVRATAGRLAEKVLFHRCSICKYMQIALSQSF